MNIENLKLLRDWVSANVTQEMFDMENFRSDNNGNICAWVSKTNCGTVGCLLGWAPFVPGLETKKKDFYQFDARSLRILLLPSYVIRLGLCLDSPAETDTFSWLFESRWRRYDNTVEGAIARLDILIKYPDLFE